MKRLLLIAALAVFSMSLVNAQEGFKVGANVGIPVGDASDFTTFGFGVDAYYFFEVGSGFLLGGTAGYHHFLGDEEEFLGITFDYDDFQFIPVGAAARFYIMDELFLGANIGYAIGINDGNDGGFHYRPMVGYDLGSVNLNLSYSAVSFDDEFGDFTFSSILLGVEIGF